MKRKLLTLLVLVALGLALILTSASSTNKAHAEDGKGLDASFSLNPKTLTSKGSSASTREHSDAPACAARPCPKSDKS